jgi:hypothetical protein
MKSIPNTRGRSTIHNQDPVPLSDFALSCNEITQYCQRSTAHSVVHCDIHYRIETTSVIPNQAKNSGFQLSCKKHSLQLVPSEVLPPSTLQSLQKQSDGPPVPHTTAESIPSIAIASDAQQRIVIASLRPELLDPHTQNSIPVWETRSNACFPLIPLCLPPLLLLPESPKDLRRPRGRPLGTRDSAPRKRRPCPRDSTAAAAATINRYGRYGGGQHVHPQLEVGVHDTLVRASAARLAMIDEV